MPLQMSVCVDAVYNGYPFEESVRAVKQIGYDTIEFWTWWDKDMDAVERAVRDAGVRVSCFCTKFISLVDPSRRDEYIQGLAQSIAVAKRLGVDRLISQVGNEIPGESREKQRRSLIDGLKSC